MKETYVIQISLDTAHFKTWNGDLDPKTMKPRTYSKAEAEARVKHFQHVQNENNNKEPRIDERTHEPIRSIRMNYTFKVWDTTKSVKQWRDGE